MNHANGLARKVSRAADKTDFTDKTFALIAGGDALNNPRGVKSVLSVLSRRDG
jgi:hypothetical protein